MSNLEDFEDIPYEEEYKNDAGYTESEFNARVKYAEEKIRGKYVLDKMQNLEKEKEFYKETIRAIFQNMEHFGGAK